MTMRLCYYLLVTGSVNALTTKDIYKNFAPSYLRKIMGEQHVEV